MDQIELATKLPTAEQYLELRELVGWRGRDVADAKEGLAGSLHGVCAMQGDVIVGMARVVGLMAAVGKEPFYQKFGFHTRPNEREGAGMLQFWGM